LFNSPKRLYHLTVWQEKREKAAAQQFGGQARSETTKYKTDKPKRNIKQRGLKTRVYHDKIITPLNMI